MNCELCKKPIENYHSKLNHLKINEDNSVNICSECADKFLKWQQRIYANLFPTKTAKRRFKKDSKVHKI